MNVWKLRVDTFWHYTDLIKELVGKDLKLKYRRSFLGYLWSILNPLLIMIIMTLVFSQMFENSIENFPVYLIIGRTLFEFMTGSTNQAMMSIRNNQSLIKKIYIPKYVFPLAKATSGIVDCIFSLGAMLLVLIYYLIIPRVNLFSWYMLLIPLVILQVYVFAVGFGFILASLVVFFRDIEYIYKAFTTAWMYLTPIFYPISRLPENIATMVINFNPLYSYIKQFRVLVMEQTMPDLGLFVSGSIWAVCMMIVGLIVFKKTQDKFILYI